MYYALDNDGYILYESDQNDVGNFGNVADSNVVGLRTGFIKPKVNVVTVVDGIVTDGTMVEGESQEAITIDLDAYKQTARDNIDDYAAYTYKRLTADTDKGNNYTDLERIFMALEAIDIGVEDDPIEKDRGPRKYRKKNGENKKHKQVEDEALRCGKTDVQMADLILVKHDAQTEYFGVIGPVRKAAKALISAANLKSEVDTEYAAGIDDLDALQPLP